MAASEHKARNSPSVKRTRGTVQRACEPCNKLKKRCDSGRPCERCIRRGMESECKDIVTKAEEKRKIRRNRVIEAARSGLWGYESSQRILQQLEEPYIATDVNSLLQVTNSRTTAAVPTTTYITTTTPTSSLQSLAVSSATSVEASISEFIPRNRTLMDEINYELECPLFPATADSETETSGESRGSVTQTSHGVPPSGGDSL
eukprot:gb/GECG01015299.1/.p1 GENE.gb/GECG01015299.1/~~gb/GECG01015299.1/.p1  ORF type:complete len:203 (+),score=15.66 gb/GECG01015299.1/:1-609(+)